MFSLNVVRVIITPFYVLALSCTIFRLFRRFRDRKSWWDDYWAGFACVFALLEYSLVWWKRDNNFMKDKNPHSAARNFRIISFWFSSIVPVVCVWSSRISICLSIARIDVRSASLRARPWVYVVTIAFGLFASLTLSQKVWVCAGNTSWHYAPTVQCYLGKTAGYISLAGDIVADSLLTAISLKFLWKVRMRRSRRRLFSWLFGANILSSLVGIYYASMVFCADKLGPNRGPVIAVSVHIKVAITLTVCSLLVVATSLYARFRSGSDDSDSESEDSTTLPTGIHSNLPGGRTTKPSGIRQSTVLTFTEFETDISVTSGRQTTSSSFMSWVSSRIGLGSRIPPTSASSRQEAASDLNSEENSHQLPVISKALSESTSTKCTTSTPSAKSHDVGATTTSNAASARSNESPRSNV